MRVQEDWVGVRLANVFVWFFLFSFSLPALVAARGAERNGMPVASPSRRAIQGQRLSGAALPRSHWPPGLQRLWYVHRGERSDVEIRPSHRPLPLTHFFIGNQKTSLEEMVCSQVMQVLAANGSMITHAILACICGRKPEERSSRLLSSHSSLLHFIFSFFPPFFVCLPAAQESCRHTWCQTSRRCCGACTSSLRSWSAPRPSTRPGD
jgi:hypothetical protein